MLPNRTGASLSKKQQMLAHEPHEAGHMIIVDPRRTSTVATAEAAAGKKHVLHLQIRNGTDMVLLNALSRLIYKQGWHDQAFIEKRTTHVDAMKATNLTQDLDEAIKLTGISKQQMLQAAEWIGKPKAARVRRRTLFLYEKG